MNILQVSNLSKSFGSKQVIDNLSFAVEEHTVYGFLGKNGAGKTTVMKMILGMLKIDQGTILVNNQKVKFGQNNTNHYIGYLADVPAFYDFLNAREYLQLCGKISDVNNLETRITEMLNLVGLEDNNQKISGYSRGMRQRLGLAQAMLHQPLLLICDEPTSALDPNGRKQILDILQSASNQTTVIFSTHILDDVERICDHVGIIADGRLAFDSDIQSLTQSYSVRDIKLSFATCKELNQFTTALTMQFSVDNLAIIIANSNLEAVYSYINQIGVYPTSVELVSPNLESIFLEVTNV